MAFLQTQRGRFQIQMIRLCPTQLSSSFLTKKELFVPSVVPAALAISHHPLCPCSQRQTLRSTQSSKFRLYMNLQPCYLGLPDFVRNDRITGWSLGPVHVGETAY
eukprot:9776594-Ditylum_brightwellii.AAC.1